MNGQVVALSDYRGTPRLGSAIEAFFSDKQLSTNTRRAYSQALKPLIGDLGWDLALDQLDPHKLLDVFQERWMAAKPSTWNTRITAIKSFVSYSCMPCKRSSKLSYSPRILKVYIKPR